MGEKVPLNGRTLLIVEDEAVILLDLEEAFKAAGFKVSTAASEEEGFKSFLAEECDLLITDFVLGKEGNGVDLIDRCFIHSKKPIPVILLSGTLPDARVAANRVLKMKGDSIIFLKKPVGPADLLPIVEKALRM